MRKFWIWKMVRRRNPRRKVHLQLSAKLARTCIAFALVPSAAFGQILQVSEAAAKIDKSRLASPEVASEIVCVCGDVKDPDFAAALARSVGAKWVTKDAKLVLARTAEDRNTSLLDARATRIEAGLKELADLQGDSATRSNQTTGLLLKWIDEYRRSRPGDFQPKLDLPTDRLLDEGLRLIGARALAALDDRRTSTYALHPNRSQRALPIKFGELLATALADRRELAANLKAVDSQLQGTGVSDWVAKRFKDFDADVTVTQVLICAARSQGTVWATIGLFDSEGRLIDSGRATLAPKYLPDLDVAGVDKVSLNRLQRDFFSGGGTLEAWRGESQEPLSIAIPLALNQLSKANRKPLVALLDDRLAPLAAKSVKNGEFDARAFLTAAAADGLIQSDKSGPWIIAKPAPDQAPEERRLDRDQLANLLALDRIDSMRLARFMADTGLSTQSSALLRLLLNQAEDRGIGIPLPPFAPEEALAVLGQLAKRGFKDGRHLAASLSAGAKAAMVSWATAGLTTLEGDVPDIARNGSEAMLQSVPPDAVVDLSQASEPTLSKSDSPVAFLHYPHRASEIRAFLVSSPEMIPDAAAYYGGSILLGSINTITLSVTLPGGQRLTAEFIDPPNSQSATTYERLPAGLRDSLRIRSVSSDR
jgi:hypothetical protein